MNADVIPTIAELAAKPVLTRREVLHLLGDLPSSTLAEMPHQPAWRYIGRRAYLRRADLETWLLTLPTRESRRGKPGPKPKLAAA
jgi:hypothetical protein